MINKIDYENARDLVARYEEQEKKALICSLNNLVLHRGKDGHWLTFSTLTGRHVTINIENLFDDNSHLRDNIIRQWTTEQVAIED